VSREITWRHRAEYAGYRIIALAIRILPRALVMRAAAPLARLTYRRSPRHFKEALENLHLAFPDLDELQRLEILHKSQLHLLWNLIDFARAASWSDDEMRTHVGLLGEEHMRAAQQRGKGVIFLTLHMGNFELGMRRVTLLGRILVLNRPFANPLLQDAITRSRETGGAQLIDRDGAARVMLRELRGGGMVAVLNDRYAKAGAVWVPLFGARAATAAGLAMLALRTEAALLPCYIVRDGDDHHTVTILPPLEVPPTGDRAVDVEAATVAQNCALEQIIRRHPEQWMWHHRRFRHSPDLELGDGPRA
jgi:KDO2-lipid IV(A) lauroyltransferase